MSPRYGERADVALRYDFLVKTLLVDIDRALLQHCLNRVGGRQPLTVATSKSQVMELLWPAPAFDVIVACERLDDGSGLALLADIHVKWPHLIRVFCSDRQRLAMVRARLGALRLRHTLAYPIKPLKLEMMLLQLAHAHTRSAAKIRGPTLPKP
jgi:DNA-binding NtrC family response regulator